MRRMMPRPRWYRDVRISRPKGDRDVGVTVKRLKLNKALDENSSLSYGASPASWDHAVLPATRHKWTRPALTPASKQVYSIYLPRMDGRLSWPRLPGNAPAVSQTRDLSITSPTPYHYTTEPPGIETRRNDACGILYLYRTRSRRVDGVSSELFAQLRAVLARTSTRFSGCDFPSPWCWSSSSILYSVLESNEPFGPKFPCRPRRVPTCPSSNIPPTTEHTHLLQAASYKWSDHNCNKT